MALALGSLVAAAAVGLSSGDSPGEVGGDVIGIGVVFSVCLPVLGAFVIRQRGGHPVGWLMIGIGVSIALHTLADQWAQAALVDDPGSLPGGAIASWVVIWLWMPGWFLATTLLPAIFPDGRPVGRRRLLARVDGIAIALGVAATAAVSWQFRGPRLVQTDSNSGPGPILLQVVGGATILVAVVLTLVSVGSLLIRYRRATGQARRQIAWVVYGAAVAVVMGLLGTVLDVGGLFQVLQALALVGGLAVAMFRYRLYDIDVVINRTLVYGALTATLAGTYLGSVLLLQLALSAVTSDNGLAVAGSTLAVAALFRPARARIQGLVDRRFYRRRYDARRTLESFSARLRDQVDLETLSGELGAVVSETLQPAHVSLWLRSPESR